MSDAVADRVDKLETKLQMERRRRKNLKEQVEQLASRVADSESRLDDHDGRLKIVEDDYENLAGVAKDQDSTALKRRVDLIVMLKRKAEANSGAYAMDYRQVKDDLAGLGHGDVSDKQAFRDMEKIAERVGGVTYPVPHPVSGNNAVELNLSEYHGVPSEMATVSDDVSSQGNGAARSDQNNTATSDVKPTTQG